MGERYLTLPVGRPEAVAPTMQLRKPGNLHDTLQGFRSSAELSIASPEIRRAVEQCHALVEAQFDAGHGVGGTHLGDHAVDRV